VNKSWSEEVSTAWKLKEVRFTQASGSQLGISDDALGEQLAENAQHVTKSNQFGDAQFLFVDGEGEMTNAYHSKRATSWT
jgi:hypothetical protein